MPAEFFRENDVKSIFMLHNVMVTFIIHLVIFVIYLALKIWDTIKTSSGNLLYRIFVYLEYSGLISGFLLFLM